MKRRGFTIFEVMVILAIIAVLVALLLPALLSVREKANQSKCKANLAQFGKCLYLYSSDYGRGIYFPDANGAGFLAKLRKTKILSEEKIYLCPSTNDEISNLATADEGDSENTTSYSGRKNKRQKEYPGIFKPFHGSTLTTTASDDWQSSGNHEGGRLVNFLFLDGHVDIERNLEIDGSEEDIGYSKFAQEGQKLADPLTN